MNKQQTDLKQNELRRAKIFDAINAASPTVKMDVNTIEEEALEILKESEM